MTENVDRRQQRGEQHREAILAAAADLVAETRSVQLSTEALAERAGVSRRTVFNHFATLEAVVTEVLARSIGEAVDALESAARRVEGDDTLDSTFARMSAVFEQTDLTPQMSFLWSVLSVDDTLPRRYGHVIDDAFHRLRDLLLATALEPGDTTDTFGRELLVTSLMNGTAFVAQRWCEETRGVVDDDSRALWTSLVVRMTDQLGRGYRHARA
ncbi:MULTISPECIES: TetR/AcrR family transcriptional regulator [Aeromicrobium]|uniref:TetR/AcrR family transcriptional regulator n=1 Tax=Aeromicrobium TaxID=2040 RepID=UPI000831175E|nr:MULTISPECIES: TetR/AcrR family transcriptional regulator [Aeromicrobium]